MAVDLRYINSMEFRQLWNTDPVGTKRSIEDFFSSADVDDAYILGNVVGESTVPSIDSEFARIITQGDLDSFGPCVAFIAAYWDSANVKPAEEIVDLVDKMQKSAGPQFNKSHFSLIYLGVALLRLSDHSWEQKHPIRSELKQKLLALKSDMKANHSHLTLAISRLEKIP